MVVANEGGYGVVNTWIIVSMVLVYNSVNSLQLVFVLVLSTYLLIRQPQNYSIVYNKRLHSRNCFKIYFFTV